MSVQSPLRVWRGETRTWKLTIWDADTEARVDLSAYSDIQFEVKTDVETVDPALISKSKLTTGVTVLAQTGDTLGQLTVTVAPADTSGVNTPAGVFKYDVWGISGSNRYLLSRPATFTIEGVVNGV